MNQIESISRFKYLIPHYRIIMRLPFILLILSLVLISGCSLGDQIHKRTYPNSIPTNQIITIHQLKQINQTSGNFNVEGYVVKIFTCPPCPKGAFCKPCMRPNIVISEHNQLLETYSLTETELILLANNPQQFALSKKYKFSIKISDSRSTNEAINDIDLVGYDVIE